MPKGVYIRKKRSQNNKIERHCKQCGISFRIHPSRIKFGVGTGKYCSKKCKNLGFVAWNKGKKILQIMGEKNPHWKGGKWKKHGYMIIYKPNHPLCDKKGYIQRSHFVMEKKLGRFLKPKEIVHHINKIRDDDRPENLRLFANNPKHLKFHRSISV